MIDNIDADEVTISADLCGPKRRAPKEADIISATSDVARFGIDPCNALRPALQQNASLFMHELRRYFGRRWRNSEDIDDLVQQVFLRVLNHQGAPVSNLRGYIYQTAHSVLTDQYRRLATQKAGEHVEFDADRHGNADLDPSEILAARQELEVAARALSYLPERSCSMFLLRRLENRRFSDIATQFGISVSAVEKHVGRSARHLHAACA